MREIVFITRTDESKFPTFKREEGTNWDGELNTTRNQEISWKKLLLKRLNVYLAENIQAHNAISRNIPQLYT